MNVEEKNELTWKILERAFDNGYKLKVDDEDFRVDRILYPWVVEEDIMPDDLHIYAILFDPEFAKAFFHKNCKHCREDWNERQITLLKVIQKGNDPIQYLARYLK